MTIIEMFSQQLEEEANTTRNMLKRVPEDKYSWQPHEKSMTTIRLATHIAELPGWIPMTIHTSELDFANNPYTPQVIHNNDELLNYFEKNIAEARDILKQVNEEELAKTWILREGDQIYSTSTKAEVIRMAMSQIIHHKPSLAYISAYSIFLSRVAMDQVQMR